MPPQPRKGTLGGNVVLPETGNPLLSQEDQSDPISPYYQAAWKQDGGRAVPPGEPRPEEGSPAAVPDGGTGRAPLHRFAYSPDNPRDDAEFDLEDDELRAMGDTVEEYGVLTPITVVARTEWIAHHPEHDAQIDPEAWWVVLMGGTRLFLARDKGLDELSFARNDALASPVKALESRLIENRRRRTLNPIQEALQFRALTQEYGVSQREVSRRTGYSPATITQRLKLLNLIDELQTLVRTRALTEEKAFPLTELTEQQQRQLWELGPPYVASRVRVPHDEPEADQPQPLTVRVAVKIAANSTPEDVVKKLAAKVDPDVLREIARLLVDNLQTAASPQSGPEGV